ncbi:Rtt106 protein [Starmerella bacillaris]|uniref:Histone chaperone RTT106 n=1 Tax=Starmerella bacillaris TaxID=1247836 RepID=A0AAV5RGI4_STABA|nr:Rtt106 protein [Starmerella bacillaris]
MYEPKEAWSAVPEEIKDLIKQLESVDAEKTKKVVSYFLNPAAAKASKEGDIAGKSSTKPKTKQKFDIEVQISQLIPVRKQVRLCVGKQGLATFLLQDPQVEFTSSTWSDYNVFLVLPVPKKAKPITNLVLLKLGDPTASLVFTVPSPKNAAGDSSTPALIKSISSHIKLKETNVEESNAITAYIGVREGVLYLMPTFVFFGFRKPLVAFLTAEIDSISITTVTTRTFSVVVSLLDASTHEFEKISHEYYQIIQDYITEHNLSDKSLAEERQAKKRKTAPSELELAEKEAEENGNNNGDNDDDGDDEEDEDVVTGSESEEDEDDGASMDSE